MDDDWSKKFNPIPCSRQITNGRWLFKAVHSYSLFKIDNKWTMTVQSSSLIFLVQDGLQIGDDCSEKFTHIPCSRWITNGRWLVKEIQSYSLFKTDSKWTMTVQSSSLIFLVQDRYQMDDDFREVHSYSLFMTDYKWAVTVQSSSLTFLVQGRYQIGDDCSEQFNHIPCPRQISNGRWLFRAVHSHSLFKIDNKWTMTVQSSSLIFLVQDRYQMDDDCSEQFSYIPRSNKITTEQ
jgi:hypothetical protein